MVPPGTATLDVGDDALGGCLGGDPDHRTDLLDGSGLEAHVRDADAMKLIDEFDGFLEFRYSGADHQTVDRGACRAGLLDQSFTADLKLPQVRIQEKSVELNCPAGLEQRAHLRHPPLEDRLGDLTAAGEFGPVPGVGRGGDDFRVDRGRRHAGQQDR